MQFLVLGRKEIKKFRTDKKHIVISVRDSNAEKVKLSDNDNRMATLFLEFTDFEEEVKDYKVFDKILANQILDFVKVFTNWKPMVAEWNAKLIVCQCEAGISRSAGIAGALSKIMNGDDQYFFDHYIPNKLVYRLILEEANKRGLMNRIITAETEIKADKFKTQEEVFNTLYKKIEKAMAEADKMKVKEHKNLLGSKKKYINAIIRELNEHN